MNTYTPTQLKDALHILKAFRDSPNYSKAIKQAVNIAIDAVQSLIKIDKQN